LLGATTLEALGMILNPIRRELRPFPMVLRQLIELKVFKLGFTPIYSLIR